jgi:hypothetical protein
MWMNDENFAFTYESELNERLFSLANYFGNGDSMDIATAGFSGTEHPFVAQCENCNACIHDFDESDCLITLHKLISPECSFVKHIKLKENFMQDVDYKDLIDRCKICCVSCKNNPFHCWPEPVFPENPPPAPAGPSPAEAPSHHCPSLASADSPPQELAKSTGLCDVAILGNSSPKTLRSSSKSSVS